jgi:polyisoprenoid-binding protein YceI
MRLNSKLALCLIAMSCGWAQERQIDTEHSTITIHVGKAGLLAAAGHEHWINAPIASGSFNETTSRVEFTVDATKLRVKPDPKVNAKDEAEIQKDMEDKVLEISRYREIKFQSAQVEKIADGWRVNGTLSLHGTSKPVSVNVKRDGDVYAGRVTIKQSDFDIKPATAAGGTIKTKNELDVEFRIAGKR